MWTPAGSCDWHRSQRSRATGANGFEAHQEAGPVSHPSTTGHACASPRRQELLGRPSQTAPLQNRDERKAKRGGHQGQAILASLGRVNFILGDWPGTSWKYWHPPSQTTSKPAQLPQVSLPRPRTAVSPPREHFSPAPTHRSHSTSSPDLALRPPTSSDPDCMSLGFWSF